VVAVRREELLSTKKSVIRDSTTGAMGTMIWVTTKAKI
jgi:hypothetical protein